LSGIRKDTYWSKIITPGGTEVPAGKIAGDNLTKLMKRLGPHRRFLRGLQRTGGSIEIWLSSYGTTNYSFIFAPALIESIHDLGCKLIVDIYPYRQNWGA
jgi:hypothetical protein